MRVEVTEVFTFEAAHRIPCEKPEYSQVHGHSHTVLATVAGEVESKEGWLLEQSDFRRRVEYHVKKLDHKYLNEVIPVVTAEGIAQHLFEALRRADWPRNVEVVAVEVRKTTTRARVSI